MRFLKKKEVARQLGKYLTRKKLFGIVGLRSFQIKLSFMDICRWVALINLTEEKQSMKDADKPPVFFGVVCGDSAVFISLTRRCHLWPMDFTIVLPGRNMQ